MLLKTSGSAFTRFARDEYTTLPERGDRPLLIRHGRGLALRATRTRHVRARSRCATTCAATFDDFVSESIQHLVHEMGTRLLADCAGARRGLVHGREPHARPASARSGGRTVYTDPFPAQGLITLTLGR